jgi:hypothetical protein
MSMQCSGQKLQKQGRAYARPSACQKQVFDRLSEVNKAFKTSNSRSSAYVDTVEGELRSKSKCLAKQAFFCTDCGIFFV